MPPAFKATRDVIVRTDRFAEAAHFYESVLGFAIVHRSDSLLGFEAADFGCTSKTVPSRACVRFSRAPHRSGETGALLLGRHVRSWMRKTFS